MMVRLVYVSRSEVDTDPRLIESIIARCKEHNPENGITGVLCYTGGMFMQVLEGGREAINRLYTDITRDPRHRDVMLLEYQEITERKFANWTMGHVNLDKISPAVLLRHSELPTLDPYRLSGATCSALLQELLSSAHVISRSPTTY
ncbi:MAG: BLUF domain-containing protein [Burkholderiaceae bacterium]